MDSAIKIIKNVIEDILTAIYQPFWAAVLLAFVAMFIFMYAKEHNWQKKDLVKNILSTWFSYFKKSYEFRRVFLLIFYSVMILSRTVLYRDIWANPLSDVMGGWGLYDADGNLTTEAIENLMLFIPFTVLLLWAFKKELLGVSRDLKRPCGWRLRQLAFFHLSLNFCSYCFILEPSRYRIWFTIL